MTRLTVIHRCCLSSLVAILSGCGGASPITPSASPSTGPTPTGGPAVGRILYVVGTKYSTDPLAAFRIDPTSGALALVTSSQPIIGYDMAFDPSGRFAYVRSVDSLSVYSIDRASGALTRRQQYSEMWYHPRVVAAGRFLCVADLYSQTIATLWVDPVTGALTRTGSWLRTLGPVQIEAHASGRFVYVMSSTTRPPIQAIRVDETSGGLVASPGSPFGPANIPPNDDCGSLASGPSGPFLYWSREVVQGYEIDPQFGSLSSSPTAPLSTGGNGGTVPAMDPLGRFLFLSWPMVGGLRSFRIAADGGLTAVDTSSDSERAGSPPVVDPSGRFVYIIYRVPPNYRSVLSGYRVDDSGRLEAVPGTPIALANMPGSIAIAP